jgi:hypothetical protein
VKRRRLTVGGLLEVMRDTLQLELIGDEAGLAREVSSSEVV